MVLGTSSDSLSVSSQHRPAAAGFPLRVLLHAVVERCQEPAAIAMAATGGQHRPAAAGFPLRVLHAVVEWCQLNGRMVEPAATLYYGPVACRLE